MRRAGVSLPPEAIWLGGSWEEPPAPRRTAAAGESVPRPSRAAARAAVGASVGASDRATERSVRADRDLRRQLAATERTGEGSGIRASELPRELRQQLPERPRELRQQLPERRTVVIRGRGAERDLTWTAHQSRRRPNRPPHHRPGFKPDRAAMWAVLLGLLLVLVAATSSHAAVRSHFRPAHHFSSPRAAQAIVARPPGLSPAPQG
jgi:hypothetical protein